MVNRAGIVRSALVLAVCALMCIAAIGALLALRLPVIQSYEDQVAYALRALRIPLSADPLRRDAP
jgi:hypothetical protein